MKPIILKINSLAEARILWHRLNVFNGTFQEYCKARNLNFPEDIDSYKLWKRFDKLSLEKGKRDYTLITKGNKK